MPRHSERTRRRTRPARRPKHVPTRSESARRALSTAARNLAAKLGVAAVAVSGLATGVGALVLIRNVDNATLINLHMVFRQFCQLGETFFLNKTAPRASRARPAPNPAVPPGAAN